MPIRALLLGLLFTLGSCGGLSSEQSSRSRALSEQSMELRVVDLFRETHDEFALSCQFYSPSTKTGTSKTFHLKPDASAIEAKVHGYRFAFHFDYPNSENLASRLLPYPHHVYSYRFEKGGHTVEQKNVISDNTGMIRFENVEDLMGGCLVMSAPTHLTQELSAPKGLVHINVHPHSNYDVNALLKEKIEPLLRDEEIRNLVYLEGQTFPFAMMQHLPEKGEPASLIWNQSKVALSTFGNATIHIAPTGMMNIDRLSASVRAVVITGGFVEACISHTIPNLADALIRSDANSLRVLLPRKLLLADRESLLATETEKMREDYPQLISYMMKSMGYDPSKVAIGFSSVSLKDQDVYDYLKSQKALDDVVTLQGKKTIELQIVE